MKKLIAILLFILPIQIFSQGNSSVKSTEGNVEFRVNNNGTIGYNSELKDGEIVWPKGRLAKYLHGVGFYISFLVGKEERTYRYSYIPVSGASDFTPGSSFQGSTFSDESLNRVYTSRLYNKVNGKELFGGTGPAWPIWRGKKGDIFKQYGEYVRDPELRNRAEYEEPLFISDEDIVSIAYNEEFGIEVETRVYLYNDEKKKNTVIISFVVKNVSGKTYNYFDFGALFDTDITHRSQLYRGIDNDVYLNNIPNGAAVSSEISGYEDTLNPGYVVIRQIRNHGGSNMQINELFGSPVVTSIANKYLYEYDFRNNFTLERDPYIKDDIIVADYLSWPREIVNGGSGLFTYLIKFSEPDESYPNMGEDKTFEEIQKIQEIEDFYLNQITSVETAENINIKLSPNPISNGNLTIEYSAFEGQNTLIQLFDVNGRNLGTIFEGISKKSNLIEYDISDLQSGVYFLRLTLGDKTVTKKFTIEK